MVEEAIAEKWIVSQMPLATCVVVRAVVAGAGEVQPLWMTCMGQIKLIQSDWQGHPRFESNSTNVDILDLINNNNRGS